MELSEVVNPHFAFPVVGVVLCAVLVFAFGFKSPVQPPSFDWFDNDKKPRKSKHKKAKTHTIDPLDSRDVSEKSTAVQRPAAASKPAVKAADKSPQPQKEAKNKTKKIASVKQTSAPEVKPSKERSHDNEAGWETVSVSKKKKNKTKRESDTEPDLMIETPKAPLSVYNVPATVPATVDVPTAELEISTVEPVPATVDVPTAELEISTVEPVPATVDVPTAELEISTVELEIPKEEPEVPQPQVQRPKKHISAKAKIQEAERQLIIDQSDKENTPEPQSQDAAELIEEITKQATKKESKKGKAKHNTEPPSGIAQSSVEPPDSKETVEKKANKKSKSKKVIAAHKEAKPQNEAEASVSNTAQLDASQSNESKLVKSPKIKKDKQKKERSPAPVQESPSTSLAESTSVTTSSSLPQSNFNSAQGEAIEAVDVPSSDTLADAGAAPEATNTVTFDEIGDWQEAKPTKKRKTKARREN